MDLDSILSGMSKTYKAVQKSGPADPKADQLAQLEKAAQERDKKDLAAFRESVKQKLAAFLKDATKTEFAFSPQPDERKVFIIHEEAAAENLISQKDRQASDEASGSVVVAVFKPGHAPHEESSEPQRLNPYERAELMQSARASKARVAAPKLVDQYKLRLSQQQKGIAFVRASDAQPNASASANSAAAAASSSSSASNSHAVGAGAGGASAAPAVSTSGRKRARPLSGSEVAKTQPLKIPVPGSASNNAGAAGSSNGAAPNADGSDERAAKRPMLSKPAQPVAGAKPVPSSASQQKPSDADGVDATAKRKLARMEELFGPADEDDEEEF